MRKFSFPQLFILALTGLVLAFPCRGQLPVLIKNINPGVNDASPKELTNVNGTLYFVATDGTTGSELYKSDGTAAGTVLVKDIYPGGGGSFPTELTNVNGTLYFQAEDGTNGKELWKSDGTAAGTVLVKDIYPGVNSSDPKELTNVNGTLFFAATDGTNGVELWKSDGTESGTVMVKNIRSIQDSNPDHLTNVNGTLYFSADDGPNGYELWKSDGTELGTVMVKNINPEGNSYPQFLTNVSGTLFFTADDDSNGVELWKSDGTAEGTVMVKNIRPGGNNSAPVGLTNINGTLFFTPLEPINGYELWKTDGTEAGTVLVKDINPTGNSTAYYLTNFDGTLYFSATNGTDGYELWKSDGTPEGTVPVGNINPGPNDSSPQYLTNVNGTLYFSADDGTNGRELWKLGIPSVEPCDPRVAGAPSTPAKACKGQPLAVTFSLVGACPNPAPTTFLVQLSSATGSFANPTNLGYATPGTTPLALPANLPTGSGYRVRIVSGGVASAASLPFKVEGPSLSVTPTVSGLPACRGGQVTVSFSLPAGSCPFPEGNQFTAQLSSATGSFNNPTLLGTVVVGANPLTIPAGIATGSGYRIRIVSSNPALTSSNSSLFQVKACPTRLSAEEPQLVVSPNPVSGSEIRVRVVGMDNPQFSLTTGAGRSLNLVVKAGGGDEFVLTPRQPLTPGIYAVQAIEGQTRLSTRVLIIE